MAFRTARPRRESDVLSPQNYCFTLDPIIDYAHQVLHPYGPQVVMGFDVRSLTKAVLKHVFYGTIHRGNSYWQVRTELEQLGVPTDVALGLYDDVYTWVKQQINQWIEGGVNYTEYSFDFLNDTDILVHQIPLHELPRYPLHD